MQKREKKWKSLCHGLLAAVLILMLIPTLPIQTQAAEVPSIQAAGALVMDAQTGEIYYEKNIDVARPAASMSKLMSIYLIFDEMAAGKLTWDTLVPASQRAANMSNNRSYSGLEKLRAGRTYMVDTLIKLVMTKSCNGSMLVLAEAAAGSEEAFVQRMNAKAESWGIDAHFADCCGFVDEGNAVTPRAMATIAKRIIEDYPEILIYSTLQNFSFQGENFQTTNMLLLRETCEGIDGLKTGFTYGAGYCFTGTASRNGRRVISVVMGTNSYTARMEESRKLLEYGFACRTQRETEWEQEAAGLDLTLQVEGGKLWQYSSNKIQMTVSGIENRIPCTVRWEVDGVLTEEQPMVWLSKEEPLSWNFCTEVLAEQTNLAVTVILPNGIELRREEMLPVAQEELSLQGRLGFRRIEMYQEGEVCVPLQIRCTQGISFTTSAGWYLDGQPIPGYQNGSFALSPEGNSSYILRGGELLVGDHILEFRCNTDERPGVQPLVLQTVIEILAEEAVEPEGHLEAAEGVLLPAA